MAIDLGNTPTGTPPSPAEKLQIRSAIGVGTTDAPTFLAQTLTGQSLTGTQATSLLNLSTTWNTTGTPTALLINVTEAGVGSSAASKLVDFVYTTAAGVVKNPLSLSKLGMLNLNLAQESGGINFSIYGLMTAFNWQMRNANGFIGLGATGSEADTKLFRDADGILALRNGVNAQAFRVYNSTDATPATNFDRASFGFTSNVLRIGTENGGTYTTARPIDFVVGGVVRMSIGSAIASVPGSFNAAGYSVTGSFIPALGHNGVAISVGSNVWNTQHEGLMLAFRGITAAFPGLKRSTVALQTTYLQARLADDSAFTNIQGKLTTDTAYTATTVVATGYITLYDSTGTAYRVPCAV